MLAFDAKEEARRGREKDQEEEEEEEKSNIESNNPHLTGGSRTEAFSQRNR